MPYPIPRGNPYDVFNQPEQPRLPTQPRITRNSIPPPAAAPAPLPPPQAAAPPAAGLSPWDLRINNRYYRHTPQGVDEVFPGGGDFFGVPPVAAPALREPFDPENMERALTAIRQASRNPYHGGLDVSPREALQMYFGAIPSLVNQEDVRTRGQLGAMQQHTTRGLGVADIGLREGQLGLSREGLDLERKRFQAEEKNRQFLQTPAGMMYNLSLQRDPDAMARVQQIMQLQQMGGAAPGATAGPLIPPMSPPTLDQLRQQLVGDPKTPLDLNTVAQNLLQLEEVYPGLVAGNAPTLLGLTMENRAVGGPAGLERFSSGRTGGLFGQYGWNQERLRRASDLIRQLLAARQPPAGQTPSGR